jgi:adenylate kinase
MRGRADRLRGSVRIDMRDVNLVLIGPPGSGKGTQAARISTRFAVPAISTGDILRAAVKAKSPLGQKVEAIMAAGDLVGDELMIDLVRERLAEPDVASGFILDGFPRTVAQAEALDAMIDGRPLMALVLAVPEAEVARRLSSRRICAGCKTLYTGGTPYGSELELCSRCGGVLITRPDDNEVTIARRLLQYRQSSEPVIDYYEARGLVVTVDGSRGVDEVGADVLAVIDAFRNGDGPVAAPPAA